MTVEPGSIDLATLASIAGDVSGAYLVERIRADGHPTVRASHGYLIQHLIEREPTVSELAALLGVSQQAASKAVVELEELGIVARLADTTDSRVRRVSLTRKGQGVLDAGRAARAALEQTLLEQLGPQRLADAKAALVSLLDIVGGLDTVRGRRVRPRDTL